MGLSSFASKPIEEVAAANPQALLPDVLGRRPRRASSPAPSAPAPPGAKGLIVTLDWSFASRRDWGSPPIPEKIDLKSALQFAPEVLRSSPRWLAALPAHAAQLPDLAVPNLALRRGAGAHLLRRLRRSGWAPPLPRWEDVAWLREQWGGPFMVKGITRPDDARRAVDAGVTAISVSNHGGNNLDSTPAPSARCPPSSTRSATRSRCCWTAASAAAATSSRRWPSAPAPS